MEPWGHSPSCYEDTHDHQYELRINPFESTPVVKKGKQMDEMWVQISALNQKQKTGLDKLQPG